MPLPFHTYADLPTPVRLPTYTRKMLITTLPYSFLLMRVKPNTRTVDKYFCLEEQAR